MSSYTLADKAAMAASRNVSYGRIQVCLEHGLPLPPLVRSTRWPKGSAHIGEDVLPGDVPEAEEPKRHTPKPKRVKQRLGYGVRIWDCDHCGGSMPSNQSVRVYTHTTDDSWTYGRQFAKICPNCAQMILPYAAPPKKMEREPLYDAAGNKIPMRWVGRCSQCGKLHNKADGTQIYVLRQDYTHPILYCYVCRECLPAWKSNCKNSPLTE